MTSLIIVYGPFSTLPFPWPTKPIKRNFTNNFVWIKNESFAINYANKNVLLNNSKAFLCNKIYWKINNV